MSIEERILREILDIEWDMFHHVPNQGGPAACQQNRKMFELMRASQIRSWSPEAAASYLEDLRAARAQGRNLMTEKYARMMEHTVPSEFREIESHLPPVEATAEALVERLVLRLVHWQEELAAKYPRVAARGRPLRSSEDSPCVTSFETYTRGELATYSTRTLALLEEHYLQMAARGENPAEGVLENMVKGLGYQSIEQAEEAQKMCAKP